MVALTLHVLGLQGAHKEVKLQEFRQHKHQLLVMSLARRVLLLHRPSLEVGLKDGSGSLVHHLRGDISNDVLAGLYNPG